MFTPVQKGPVYTPVQKGPVYTPVKENSPKDLEKPPAKVEVIKTMTIARTRILIPCVSGSPKCHNGG